MDQLHPSNVLVVASSETCRQLETLRSSLTIRKVAYSSAVVFACRYVTGANTVLVVETCIPGWEALLELPLPCILLVPVASLTRF